MKQEDIKKLKIALVLVLIFIPIKSFNEVGAVGSSKAFVTSLFIGLPIMLGVYWVYGRAQHITETMKRAIGYISVPISLGLWRWLHMTSKHYETVLALVLCYTLVLSIYIESRKFRSTTADIGEGQE